MKLRLLHFIKNVYFNVYLMFFDNISAICLHRYRMNKGITKLNSALQPIIDLGWQLPGNFAF